MKTTKKNSTKSDPYSIIAISKRQEYRTARRKIKEEMPGINDNAIPKLIGPFFQELYRKLDQEKRILEIAQEVAAQLSEAPLEAPQKKKTPKAAKEQSNGDFNKLTVESMVSRLQAVIEQGFSTVLLADALKVAPITLESWLEGKHTPCSSNISKVSTLLRSLPKEWHYIYTFDGMVCKLKELLDGGETPYSIAKAVGVTPAAVRFWLAKRTKRPCSDNMKKLHKFIKNTSL